MDRGIVQAALLPGCLIVVLIILTSGLRVRAESGPVLWEDPATGQVFLRPGRGRVEVPLSALVQTQTEQVADEVEKRVEAKTRAQLEQAEHQITDLKAANSKLQAKVVAAEPAWQGYMANFGNHLRMGALVYGDYALYTHTSFGPQFQENLNPPGPGNNMYNSFDLTRAYFNFFYTPTDDWLVRLTPQLYRQFGAAAASTALGANSAIGSNLNGGYNLQMKFAYLQYAGAFDNVPIASGDTITLGMQSNPFVSWEEDLMNFRFVTASPWNWAGLPSAQLGISVQGPLHIGDSELTYLQYDIGLFNNAGFRQYEATNTKQVMARLTYYPFGSQWRFGGLGITGFYDYGYGNTTPDAAQLPTWQKGPNTYITRISGLIHYTDANWGIAGQFDYGRNAFNSANLWSGSGPPEAFGIVTPPSAYGPMANLANALLNNGQSRQEGFDFFGHYHIDGTPFTLFGLFQEFLPNTKVNRNPFDMQRFTLGVWYQYNDYLRFALSSQNLSFFQDQFTFPLAYARQFGPMPNIPGTKVTGNIADAVPRDIHSFYLNVEFSY
jgi:hypothetical protein